MSGRVGRSRTIAWAKPNTHEQYGGWIGLRFDDTGFFRLEEAKGRWWLVTPQGNAFLSFGLNHVEPGLLRNPYNREHWLNALGLNETC